MRSLYSILLLLTVLFPTNFTSKEEHWQEISPDQSLEIQIPSEKVVDSIIVLEKPLSGSLTGIQNMYILVNGKRLIHRGSLEWTDNNPLDPGIRLEISGDFEKIESLEIRSGYGVGLVKVEIK